MFFVRLFVAGLLAVGHDLRCQAKVLLSLNERERMTKSLVLDDGRVVDTLVLAEHAVGKNVASPANFQRLVPVVEQLDVLAFKALRHFGLFHDDLLAVVVEGELRADVALLTVAENVVQPRSGRSQWTVEILRPRRRHGKALVISAP
jgi:hypothetical protein